jgi:ElaB/YqjD/DUF883 family membrane-anchored ribosome-binding protein
MSPELTDDEKRVRDLAHEKVRQQPWVPWAEAVEDARAAVRLVNKYVRDNPYKGQFDAS